LVFVYLAFAGLYFARDFLVPLALAAIIAMLLTPIVNWLEQQNTGRILSALLPVLLFVGIISAVIALLWWQAAGVIDDANRVSTQISKLPGNLQDYIDRTLGISAGTQQQILSSRIGERIAPFVSSLTSIIGKSLLVIVYVFLLIFYRDHLMHFILRLVPEQQREHVRSIVSSGGSVAQKYLAGIARMVAVLWVMYGIAFSLVGVRHALFFAVLCGILEIVPYLGNITGSAITALMAYVQGGSGMALWMLAIYGIVQFTQTYMLEPLVVGAKVSINPLFTIIALILGDILWGVPGMILAIPLFGILKIVCDNVPGLEAYGFLIGEVKYHKENSNA